MHAWPEVYFPGIGWVEFEPTSSEAPLIRPATPQSGLQPAVIPETTEEEPAEIPPVIPPVETGTPATVTPTPWLSLVIWAAVLLLLAFFFQAMNRQFALATRAAEYVLAVSERRGDKGPAWIRNAALFILADPFERAFNAINLNLRWQGQPPESHFTPAERAKALKELMPGQAGEIDSLLKEYHASQYSPRSGDLSLARHASRQLFWLGLRTFLDRLG